MSGYIISFPRLFQPGKAALEQLGALSDNRSRMHEARVDALRSVGAAQDDERRATRDEIAKRRQ
jgi:hypothetical protein